MTEAAVHLAVVIPYFQREAGLLRRALDSVNGQTYGGPLRVLVVDDASPHPARDELAGWQPGEGVTVQIIEQANAGPGLARNRALDELGESVEYIAFLDSDDYWAADHLAKAVAALDGGADLYFSDTLFEDSGTRLMDRMPDKTPDARAGTVATGESLEALILHGFVHTPTVVYRLAGHARVRFPAGFYRFGEDQTFWLQLCAQGARGVFSTEVQAYGGLGVNIYAGSSWGTPAQLATTSHEIRYRRHALARVPLSPAGRELMTQRLARARRSLARQILHWCRRGKLSLCLSGLGDDPRTLAFLPRALLEAFGVGTGGRRQTD